MTATLYIVGAFFEMLGIVLIGAPDLVPGAISLAGWARVQWRALQRRLGFQGGGGTTTGPLQARIEMRGKATISTGGGAMTTLDEKVSYLLRRDRETQRDTNALRARVEDLEGNLARRLEELRGDMKTHVEDELTAAQADWRTARIGGTVALAFGLVLTTLGNFA
jgi:hypothetical protein